MPNCEILTIYKSIYNFLLFEEVATFHPNFLCPLQLFKFLGKILFRNATFPSFPFIENKEKKKKLQKTGPSLDYPSWNNGIEFQMFPKYSFRRQFPLLRFFSLLPRGELVFEERHATLRMSAMCLRWLLRYERGAITFFSCRLNERN